MTGRVWLVQFLEHGVVSEYLDPNDVVWPAVSRFHEDIEVGDNVILWAAGAKDAAGVFALGVVDGALEDLDHAADYQDPEGPRRVRPSMPVRYTHFFDDRRIGRADLKAKPAFSGFSLFLRANQQNPFPVTDEQWHGILDCVPGWSDLSAPEREFVVTLQLRTSRRDRASTAMELEQFFAQRSFERFGHAVCEVGVESAENDGGDQLSSSPDPGVLSNKPLVIDWERRLEATSKPDALRRVYAELYADPDGFGDGVFSLQALSGG